MPLTSENFYEILNTSNKFHVLPEEIDSIDLDTFMRVFGDAEAGVERNIVYVFRTEKPIPRVKGESDVVYIGETKGTFRKGYLVNAKRFTSKLNSMKYHIFWKLTVPFALQSPTVVCSETPLNKPRNSFSGHISKIIASIRPFTILSLRYQTK